MKRRSLYGFAVLFLAFALMPVFLTAQGTLAAALSTATGEKYTAVGWPLGPEYAASSNVDNAYRLQGKLLLVVGEMDQNVDPASTLQVVNALIKANKTFDLLVIPGGGHGAGGAYGERKRNDFFVHNLLGVEPPDWNKIEVKK